MRKIFISILFWLLIGSAGAQVNSGAIKIVVAKYSKTDKKYFENDTVFIAINNEGRKKYVSDTGGSVLIKNISPGKYSVTVGHDRCESKMFRDIIVGDGKTAYVTIPLTCEDYIQSLTRKEKKKLGYK